MMRIFVRTFAAGDLTCRMGRSFVGALVALVEAARRLGVWSFYELEDDEVLSVVYNTSLGFGFVDFIACLLFSLFMLK